MSSTISKFGALDTTSFPNGRWLMCRPEDYDVRYQINPWMDLTKAPHKALASTQWTALHHRLLRSGVWVEYVEHATGFPDMVFTANAGLTKGKKAALSNFRFNERKGEEGFFRAWFEANGFVVGEVSSGTFEGEGDALFVGDTLVCGSGFRSDRSAHDEAARFLDVKDVLHVDLVDPRFYHLDTCFCPLDSSSAMVLASALAPGAIMELEKRFELIRVSEPDALRFVCNSVVLGREIVVPAGCPTTYGLLREKGYTVHPVELTEFIKAGGAAKCLSLKLDH